MEKIRKKITKNSLERETDVERFLNIVNNETETAQMARLKQNFERKNKKYSQEAEQLQVRNQMNSHLNLLIFRESWKSANNGYTSWKMAPTPLNQSMHIELCYRMLVTALQEPAPI
jgi:hypothetical protein